MAKEFFRLTELGLRRQKESGFVGVHVNGDLVNLVGKDIELPVAGGKQGAPKTKKYRAATQKDLKAWFEKGFQKIIEKVSESDTTSNG